MIQGEGRRFVDHPAPSAGLITMMSVAAAGFVLAILLVLRLPPGRLAPWLVPVLVAVLIVLVLILALAFWLVYTTYYTLDRNGLTVRYGPSTRSYRWDEFQTVFWRRGVFATKIGWVTVTPCVRLSDAVALKRRRTGPALYLTPNEPKVFIETIARFAPELTREMMV